MLYILCLAVYIRCYMVDIIDASRQNICDACQGLRPATIDWMVEGERWRMLHGLEHSREGAGEAAARSFPHASRRLLSLLTLHVLT